MRTGLRRITASGLILLCVITCCAKKEAGLMPVSSFIIELKDNPENVFSENTTTYSITYSDTEFTLPETASQNIVDNKRNDFTTTSLIKAGIIRKLKSGNSSLFLTATRYLDINNPRITEKAEELKNGKDTVLNISRYVYNHIISKKAGIPMLPASVILENRTGDCTEHSILTAALLRAVRIPARCVVGVILCEEFQGKRNIFVYHMWVEAYNNGQWIMVDSTRPDDIHPNRYIAFTYHPLTSETPMSYIEALSALTDITITRIGR